MELDVLNPSMLLSSILLFLQVYILSVSVASNIKMIFYICIVQQIVNIQIGVQEMEEQSQKSQFNEFKQKIFNFTYELVSNEFSIVLYLCLIVIENVQFIGYYNNGVLVFNTLGFGVFSQVARYVNLLIFLREGNINVYLVPLFFLLNVVHVILMVIGYRAYQERTEKISRSISDRNFHKNKVESFINLLTVGYTTVLTIPVFQTSITAFYCDSSNPFTMSQDCYVGSQIFIVVLGILNCFWLFLINFFYAMYYFNRNPFSECFMTCSSNWFNMGKFIIKIAPMIYMMYDPTFSYPVLFFIVMNVSYAGYLAVFSKFLFSFYRYNFKLQKILIGIEFFVCTFNIHFVIVYVFQDTAAKPSLLMGAWALMALLLSLIVVNVTERMKKSLLVDINTSEKKKLPQVLEYLIYLINDTEAKFKQGKGEFYVVNIAKTHKQECQDRKCYCELFFKEQKRPGYHKNKTAFYMLLLAIIDRIIKSNKKAYPFFILKAYILFYKMESEIKAATTISEVMSDKLDFTDDMLIKGLLFELNEQYSDTRDMEIYRKFNQFMLRQEEESLKLTELYLSYWEELVDQKSSIPKLQMILKKIKQSRADLESIVDSALKIFHNHVRVLLLYKNLLKEVANDYLGSIRCEERYKIGLKQNKLSNVDTVNKIQFRQNEDLLVINSTRNYSTHNETMGKYKIISISSNVKEFLGYTNTELMGESINKLLPRIYHSIHDEFIDGMLDRKNSQIESRQIRIFPNTVNGCIIECNLITKFMPSIVHGINIVSFMEQCDKEKDQFFIIYNGNTGIVDSMTAEAEMMLKDDSHRGGRNVLTIPDNITDLLPNWDYKQEVWRERNKRGKSAKTIPHLSDCSVDVKQIELFRSDGFDQKFIKILKFRGNFFTKMLSLENQSIRESNTIQKFLEHKRQVSVGSEYEKMDTGQIEEVIHFQTKKVVERERERKKTISSLKKLQKEKIIDIDQDPPETARWCFSGLQIAILLVIVMIALAEVYIMFGNIDDYEGDTKLVIYLSGIQSELSDTTFIFCLVLNEIAYTESSMVLPYAHYSSSMVDVAHEIEELRDTKLVLIKELVEKANPYILQRVDTGQFSTENITVDIKYSKGAGTMDYYTKPLTLIQAAYQYLTYGQELLYKIGVQKESVQTVIPSTSVFYIFVNNIHVIPVKMHAAKRIILHQIDSALEQGITLYSMSKLVMGALIVLSTLITIIFYRYVLNSYILRVFTMYEQIKIQKIADYKNKCSRYKIALQGKEEKDKQSENNLNKTLQILGEGFDKSKSSVEGADEESRLMEGPKLHGEEEQEEEEHFLNFQSKPNLKRVALVLLAFILLYTVIMLGLSVTFKDHTHAMLNSIHSLNSYTEIQNSIVQIRLYIYFSLNLFSYWDQSYMDIINKELAEHMDRTLELMNDTSLNLTTYRPFISAKYHEFKKIQMMVRDNNVSVIQDQIQHITGIIEDIDDLQVFLANQSLYYQQSTQVMAQEMSYHINTSIVLAFIFFILFWVIGVRYIYIKICEEHSITYEMYNIIGYNLRKEIDAAK